MIIMDFWFQVLILAVLLDVLSGEPPVFIHPVVWMGKLTGLFVRRAPARHRKLYGLFMVVFCVGVAALVGLLVISLGENLLGLIIAAFLLKSTFSIRMLLISARGIRKDLDGGRIKKVRSDLKTFVGRDTSKLNEHQSASAVIESVAESFVDGILSPLFYFLLFGLPGALAFRMINTLDSMVGYKKEPFIDIGYASARLDDMANWVPARLSLVFISIVSVFSGKPLEAIKTCIHDHDKTASPNSGWSMAAVAGALEIRLEKVGYHVLGAEYNNPRPFHINKAVKLVGFSSFLVIAGIFLIGKVPLVGF
ncbi:putative cobalamin biosynthesis protein CobD [Candidatus Methanoperedens nitroreducens]|uniref:Probable cobalamin biosynthesis protein CobD n=2 Tax=Candidatus Methanoperedens nitratireducens TaxID=1392998 RepID=A0A284VM44_9EURY|nr:putative cobalamin biosynthesis protein CobD [Candidatus Methanoperedens nitroreducens]